MCRAAGGSSPRYRGQELGLGDGAPRHFDSEQASGRAEGRTDRVRATVVPPRLWAPPKHLCRRARSWTGLAPTGQWAASLKGTGGARSGHRLAQRTRVQPRSVCSFRVRQLFGDPNLPSRAAWAADRPAAGVHASPVLRMLPRRPQSRGQKGGDPGVTCARPMDGGIPLLATAAADGVVSGAA